MSSLSLVPSLFLFFGIISIIYAAALHYFLKIKDQQAVDHWSLGSLIWGCAILLTIFRQELPLLLSYFMANGIAAVAYVVLNRALKSLITVSARPARLEVSDALIFLVYTISLYALDRWMTGDFKDVAKTSFVSAWVVLMSCLGARYCLQIHEQYGLKLARNFAYLYITVALLWLGRILAALGVQVTYAFDTALINTLIWVAIFITGIVKYMVFPLLLLQKTENDKQEQLRQSLVRANKTVTSSALSASIAHELNQPLAAMRINSQVLLKALEAQQKNAQAGGASLEMTSIVRDILQDNERASQIIVTLRSIFRQTPGATEAVDSALLIRKTLQLLGKEIERRQVQLELQWVDGVCIQIPEDELHQVLMNLIFNSLEALETRPAGQARILIQSARRGAQLEITVADNGPGVAAEIKDMLFEILSSNKTSGMGLGLWLCKFIVERHGGTITYQNSPLGGANFSILLPCHTSGSPSLASGQSIRPDHPIG
jgi:signal transduction histidine kinase